MIDASTEPARATRPAGMDHAFNQPSALEDPAIEPDRVGPVVEGYFHLPPVWIGEAPPPDQVHILNPAVHHAAAYRAALRCGINVRVNRDGFFLFDFTHWPLASPVVIPGFVKPAPPYYAPRAHQEAENLAEAAAIIRAQVMNAHQVCLVTARWQLTHSGGSFGYPVTAWSTHKALTVDTPPAYWDDVESHHALAHNFVNNKDQVVRERAPGRSLLPLDIVQRSFELLDETLVTGDLSTLRLIEGGFIAMNRRRERRFGEAITLGWTVCEQLIALAWRRLLDGVRDTASDRMSKERRKKLNGRDYPASVMTELLELHGDIDQELFRMLDVARRARNGWAHEMRSPHESEIRFCLIAAERLLKQLLNIDAKFSIGSGRAGVPQWPVWLWSGYAGTTALEVQKSR